MLLKKEKSPKIIKSSPNNRLFVSILLGTTIALCLAFLLYRKITTLINSRQSIIPSVNISLPITQLPLLPTTSLDSQLDPVLRQSPGTWNIFAQVTSPLHSAFTYQRGLIDNQDSINQKLIEASPQNFTLISQLLPEGLKIAQYLDEKNGLYAFRINLPDKQIVMIFVNPDQSVLVSETIPKASLLMYWSLVSQF